MTTQTSHSALPLAQATGSDREEILRSMLDAYPDPSFLLNEQGLIIGINAAAGKWLGSDGDRFRGHPFSRLLDDPYVTHFSVAVAKCRANEERASLEACIIPARQRSVEVLLFLSTLRYGTLDHHAYTLVVIRDRKETKQRELDLLRFSNVAHHTVNPLEITDPEGRIVYVNPAFEKASGFESEELIGKNPNVFGSGKHTKAFWKDMWSTIKAGRVWTGEIENRRRNGEPFYTFVLISPIIDKHGVIVGYFGVHRDISDQKNFEKQLIHAQKLESIGLLAAGIAHEVGNPLTSISSLVQVIQRETKEVFTQEKLELIKSQITRISRIIRDLVDFSRRSSHEIHLTDINKGLREAIEIVRVGKKAKEVGFTVSLDPSVPPLPLVADQVEQVFINMLINAVDAINDVRYEGHKGVIGVKSAVHNGQVNITIQDNGKGIAKDALPKIFQPFYTTKKVGEGTGLGLWVSYGIIKSFQGEIAVQSLEGQGTTFTISLPLTRTTS